MKHHKSIVAIAIAFGLGLAASTYAAEPGGGQGGMQPGSSKGSLEKPESSDPGSTTKKKSGEASQKEKGDVEAPPTTTGKPGDATGGRSGESGSGQGSGGGSQSQPAQPGSGMGTR